MSKIPTAEELYNQFPHTVVGYISKGNCLAIAQTLAKLHVKAALEAVYEKGLMDITSWDGNPYTGEGSDYLDKDKILNSYPENLIQ